MKKNISKKIILDLLRDPQVLTFFSYDDFSLK